MFSIRGQTRAPGPGNPSSTRSGSSMSASSWCSPSHVIACGEPTDHRRHRDVTGSELGFDWVDRRLEGLAAFRARQAEPSTQRLQF